MVEYSIVIPVYNSEKTIQEVVERIEKTIIQYDNKKFEIILVNDHSSDNVLSVLKSLATHKNYITVLSLAKNSGQHNALIAGMHEAKGKYIICLDDDLQTIPEEMPKLIEKIKNEDFDVVYGKYIEKKHNLFRNFGSWLNEKMAAWLIQKPAHVHLSSYFIAKKYIIDEVIKYQGPYTYLAGLILRVTNTIANVPMDHNKRTVGKSNYSFKKLFSLWLNGFTNFSVKPLRLTALLGAVISALSFLLILYLLIQKYLLKTVTIDGWVSILGAVLLMGGIQLISVGLIGEYLGRNYLSVNQTPQYVIKERIEKKDAN